MRADGCAVSRLAFAKLASVYKDTSFAGIFLFLEFYEEVGAFRRLD